MSYGQNTALIIDEDALRDEVLTEINLEADAAQAANQSMDVQGLREKIKSARLEKLMASQLEQQFQHSNDGVAQDFRAEDLGNWDSDFLTELPQPANAEMTADQRHDQDELDAQAAYARLQGEVSAYMKNFAIENEPLSSTGQTQINQQQNAAKPSFDRQANEIAALTAALHARDMEILESKEAALTLSNMTTKLREELIEAKIALKQTNQTVEQQAFEINALERELDASSKMHATLNDDLANHREESRQQKAELRNSLAQLTREREKSEDANRKMGELETIAKTSRTELEMAGSQAQDRLESLESYNEKIDTLRIERDEFEKDLKTVQKKFDELNARVLDNQTSHFARVTRMEETITDLREKLEVARKASTPVQMTADEALIALKEDMVKIVSEASH